MDEFHKPYEYEEEKTSGFLLVFVILLASVEAFLSISLIVQGYEVTARISDFGSVFLGAGILYLLYLLFTIIICYKTIYQFVFIAKIFLIVRVVFAMFCLGIIYTNASNDASLIGVGMRQYRTIAEMTLVVLILPACYFLLFSVGWFFYFMKSKKCKAQLASKGYK